ncbi:MAG TPA: sugar phosphate nucleotidyltransferase, partial [bacterium]|nr:sugar phosphate nucleotidyltransferase [bacterium]
GRPVLHYVLTVLCQMGIRKPKVVVGYEAEKVCSFLKKWKKESGTYPEAVLQREQKGTGHAVMTARSAISRGQDDLLIWPGDMPLLTQGTLEEFIRQHRGTRSEASVLSSLRVDPTGYGRILRAGGRFYAIREELDATPAEKRGQEVNTGIYLFRSGRLFRTLRDIRPENKKGEFYLTDCIEILSKNNCRLHAFPLASSQEGQGINSRADLAEVTRVINQREIEHHMEKGVTFVAPDQTYIAQGIKIGRDTVIYPWCYIEAGVRIGRGCQIGPYAKIRKGSMIGDGSIVGSFVEVNRSKLGKKVYAKHLTYLGDAVVGDQANIGAGTITANFDGSAKHTTRIGKKVLVGSNTVFVAPVNVGDNAQTGAGAVVTRGSHVKKREVVVGIPARPLKKKGKRD